MPGHPVLVLPASHIPPAVQAVRTWCGQARERSWALRQLSQYQRADVARLLGKSTHLLARSRRRLIKLLP